jgi:hypothetical protein|tara:strand:+ start:316 stop:459 length:144 start_codon:yes stop_codon:yes gene_type:complete
MNKTIIKEALEAKLDELHESVWGTTTSELNEIVYKIDQVNQQLKLVS